MPRRWRVTLAALVYAVVGACGATPFVPSDDTDVLERLPDRNTGQYRELRRLRAAGDRGDVKHAVALAETYYRIARSEGDPRYLGYAQAALAPWWKDPEAPTAVLVARATLLQSSHEFERALADLDRAIARDPRNGRALLVRATIHTVQGRYVEARADCPRLFGLAAEAYVLTCVATLDSLAGRATAATATLARALASIPSDDADGRAWVESLLGEIAHRRGDRDAERHFRAALAADPRDLYTLGAYSDWLLDNGRPAEVVALVRNETRVDALLLRLALAQQSLRSPEVEASRATLRARFAASRARGDVVHRREEARFALHTLGEPQTALRLARDNWAVQKEPADLRILAEAAAATEDAAARETVRKWFAATGLEYPAVAVTVGLGAPAVKAASGATTGR